MDDHEHLYAAIHWAIDHDITIDREDLNAIAEVRTVRAHCWMAGVEFAFLVDLIEQPKGNFQALAFLGNELADCHEILEASP